MKAKTLQLCLPVIAITVQNNASESAKGGGGFPALPLAPGYSLFYTTI
jgi:hypothetical protein